MHEEIRIFRLLDLESLVLPIEYPGNEIGWTGLGYVALHALPNFTTKITSWISESKYKSLAIYIYIKKRREWLRAYKKRNAWMDERSWWRATLARRCFNILENLTRCFLVQTHAELRHCSHDFYRSDSFLAQKASSRERERIRGALSAQSSSFFFIFFFFHAPLPSFTHITRFSYANVRRMVGRRKKALPREKHTRSRRDIDRLHDTRKLSLWKLDRPMLGEHLSATSRDGHTTRQLMLRHSGCTRAVTPRATFVSRPCVWRLLSLIFRFLDFARWFENFDFEKDWFVRDKKKVFFFFYSIKRTRVVDRSIFLVSGQQRNFAILRFVLFFIFLAHSTIAKFLAGRLKGKRSLTDRRTQFRSPLEWEIGKQSWQTNFSCGNDAVKQRTTSFCYGRIHIHIIFLEKSQHPWEMLV